MNGSIITGFMTIGRPNVTGSLTPKQPAGRHSLPSVLKDFSLDLIISTLRYDPGYLYILEAGQMMRDLVQSTSTNFASSYASQGTKMQTKIDDIIEAIESKYS
jgi:hypothetical protein